MHDDPTEVEDGRSSSLVNTDDVRLKGGDDQSDGGTAGRVGDVACN